MTSKSATDAPQKNRRGYLLVFAGALCISFAAFFVKGASVDPSAVAFYRLVFGGGALFLVAVLQRTRLAPYRKTLWIVALAGLLFCCDLLFWHASIVIVGPGIATILTNFQVIFLALYSAFFLKEKMSLPQKFAIPLALVGLALLLGIHESGIPPSVALGTSLGVLSGLFYTFYILTLRRTRLTAERLSPVANIAWVSWFAVVFVGVYCLASGVSLAIPDLRTGVTLAFLGVFCQSLGWLLLSLGIPLLPPFRAGLIMLAQPAFSFLWDILFYGTATGPLNILGAAIATAAIGMGIYNRKAASDESGAADEK